MALSPLLSAKFCWHYFLTRGLCFRLFEDVVEAERDEDVSLSLVKLWLELDPVETQSVEESRKAFHQDEDRNSEKRPETEDEEQNNSTPPVEK